MLSQRVSAENCTEGFGDKSTYRKVVILRSQLCLYVSQVFRYCRLEYCKSIRQLSLSTLSFIVLLHVLRS